MEPKEPRIIMNLNEKIKKANERLTIELEECNSVPFEELVKDVSGFDICAVELDDGRYVLYDSGEVIDEIPKNIKIKNGNTYQFEEIDYGREINEKEFPRVFKNVDIKKGKFCNLMYV
jgi:hypothetical protein